MKFKSIRLVFPRPLTQPQEYQLAADMQGIVKAVHDGIAKYREKLDTHKEVRLIERMGGSFMVGTLRAKLLALELNTSRYFAFDKPDGTEGAYIFAYAYEELSAINTKLPLPKQLGEMKITGGSAFSEDRLIKSLELYTFPSIGFKAGEVRIERGEYEKVGVPW